MFTMFGRERERKKVADTIIDSTFNDESMDKLEDRL